MYILYIWYIFIEYLKYKDMKTTIKNIKEQAQSIKDGGLKGTKAWDRLQNYMRSFDNVFEMWGELSVQKGQSYTPLSKIVKSDFFFN